MFTFCRFPSCNLLDCAHMTTSCQQGEPAERSECAAFALPLRAIIGGRVLVTSLETLWAPCAGG